MTVDTEHDDGSCQDVDDRVQAMIAWLTNRADEIRTKGRGSVEFHFRGQRLTCSIHEYEELKLNRQ